MTDQAANLLADLCYLMAGLSFALAMGGWAGYRHIQATRRDNDP